MIRESQKPEKQDIHYATLSRKYLCAACAQKALIFIMLACEFADPKKLLLFSKRTEETGFQFPI